MKVRRIENTSEEFVPVRTEEGRNIYLKPGQSVENVRVNNLEEMKGKVKVVHSLNEVI